MTYKIGDKVMWRGSWGRDAPEVTTIRALELCESERAKYGEPVDEIDEADKSRTVFMLENGQWSYGNQIVGKVPA